MTQLATTLVPPVNVAQLLSQVGEVPPERVRLRPTPGTATVEDVLEACERKPLCELVDGTLVDKTVGNRESILAVWIAHLLTDFVRDNDLGILFGADGLFRMARGNVRVPDAAVVTWDQLPGRKMPDAPVWEFSPASAIEVLSRSNTRREMQTKLVDYFESGTRMVWYIDPETQTAEQFTSPSDVEPIDLAGKRSGGDALPGFELPLADVFQD